MSPSGADGEADGEGKKDVEEAEGAAEFKVELDRERRVESSTAGEPSSALKRATFLLFLEE